MVDQGRRINVGDEEWTAIYAGRVADLLARAEARGVMVFWIGLPVMGLEPYGRRVIHINQVVEAVCKVAPNCRFWDSRHAVADAEGRYVAFWSDGLDRSVRIRGRDSIHLTEEGGRMMAEKFLAETSGWTDYRQKGKPAAGFGPVSALRPPAPSAGEGEAEEILAEVTEHKLYSPARGRETVYVLAEPRGPGLWPVVLLLHGAWDGARTWREHLGDETLAEWADRWGLILLMADGEPFGWYVDGRESAIETYLMEELLPHLGRTRPEMDQSRLAVLGLSMGGHGALTLALKHPQIFRGAGSLSGVTDLAAHAGDRPLHRQLKIEEALGPAGPGGGLWRERGAAGLTEKFPENLVGRPLLLSVGREDRLTLAENRAYHQLLNRLKISHVYRETPGGHDWPYWAGELPAQLEYMAERLRRLEEPAGP
jgi:S-formylglutathione hydrolase FrmB